MKRIAVLILALALIVAACSSKAEDFSLKADTPAYALAKDMAKISPALDPDKTTILATTATFNVTAAEVIQAARNNLGLQAAQLATIDAGQMKRVMDRAAGSIAERRILLAAAAKAKTVLPAGDLDKAMQAEYAKAGGEPGFLEALKKNEVPIEHVRKSVEEGLLINRFLEGIAEKAGQISDEELRQAYAQESQGDKTATVRHVLILTQGKSDAEKAAAKTKIEGLLAQAKAGADIAELAKTYSEDPGSKENGGLYESFPRGQMVKPFEDAAFSVPVGQLSGIIETEYGYHFLKVIDRQKETRPFEAVKAELEARLKQTKQGTAVQDAIKALKDKAKLKVIGL